MGEFGERDASREADGCFSWSGAGVASALALWAQGAAGLPRGLPVSLPVWLSLRRAILLMSCLPSVLRDSNVLQLISQALRGSGF